MPYAKRGRGGGGNNTRFTGKRGGSFRSSSSRGRPTNVAFGIEKQGPIREDDGTAAAERFEEVKVYDEIDEKLGFWKFESNAAAGETKVGWLVNMHQVGCFTSSSTSGEMWKCKAEDTQLMSSDPGPVHITSRRSSCR